MKKGLIGLVSVAALMVLGACSSSTTSSSSSSSTKSSSDASNQWSEIKKAGVIKVGTSADFAPFEFHTMVNGKDTIVGADIDMMDAIGKEVCKKSHSKKSSKKNC